MTAKTGYTYKYDGENRLVEVRNASNVLIGSYKDNERGLRIRKIEGTVTTYYGYMGDKCVYQEEYTGTAQTKKTAYIYVGNQNSALCGRIAPQRQSAFITDSLRLCRRSQVKRGHDCRTLRAAIVDSLNESAMDGALKGEELFFSC